MASRNGKRSPQRKRTAPKKPPKPAAKMPSLVPAVGSINGKGALWSGGVPGNKGGTGRPPSAIREQLRGSFADRIAVLEAFADGRAPLAEKCPKCGYEPAAKADDDESEGPSAADRLRALDMMAKYGLEEQQKIVVTLASPELHEKLTRQAQLFTERLTGDALAIVRQITDEVWQ